MLRLDGSHGEGGGQILRTALGLSLATGTPFRIDAIRANRRKPGLRQQHLTATRAAAEIGRTHVDADIGTTSLEFHPRDARAGNYDFAVGTAGSATLVFQTVLPALLGLDAPSRLTLTGGTHNPHAPPFDFLDRTFLPILRRMGAEVDADLRRPGFYPAGGGRVHVVVRGGELRPIELRRRIEVRAVRARAGVAQLPIDIAEREIAVLERELEIDESSVESIAESRGPGNVVIVEIESDDVTEVATGFGERGVRAESVARRVADEAKAYISTGAPVGEHLADQLLIPLALAGGGAFSTGAPSLHTRTNAWVIEQFLPVAIDLREDGARWTVEVRRH